MPHFGLMDEEQLGPVEGPLQRARLHIRGGKRRLRQGKISAGIVTLYDAVSAAMESYIASNKGEATFRQMTDESIQNEQAMFAQLVRAGVIDGSFDFMAFDEITEKALNQELNDYDYGPLLGAIESLMKQLSVMPFDESLLPPEDTKTF
jgi:hypothetical protein